MGSVRRHSWQDIRDEIQNRILHRELLPGDKLPKDEELAAEFGCARTTVQRAMRELADKGAIVRKRKGGTHVMRDPVTRASFDIPITRLEVEQLGAEYSYQLHSARLRLVPARVGAQFGFSERKEMLNIKALHLADGAPYIFEDRWVSAQTVPEILDVDLHQESANEWLIRNKPYDRCDIRFYAVNASIAEARIMQIEKGAALFVVERTTWVNGAPITSVRALARPGYQMHVGV
ncbi:MAG: GntR family transcriptional regulator [Hyphomicrobiales bacterium]